MNLKLTVALKAKIVDLFVLERRDIAELADLYGKTGFQIEAVLREALAGRNGGPTGKSDEKEQALPLVP